MRDAILVTGGAGFIGGNFIHHRLSQHPELVVNLDKLTYAGNLETLASVQDREDYQFIHGDICDGDAVSQLLRRYRPRAVVHFAAESHVDRSIHGPAAFLRTNIDGTFTLLEATRTYLAEVSVEERERFRFLHVSTDEVYGSLAPEEPAFTERTPYAPNSPYAASKASSDMLVRAWGHTYDVPVLITNCSNNYGPYQFPEKLIPLMITHALAGKPLPIYGDGAQVRDWLYVEDHCRAISAVLAGGRVGETYNVGGANQRSNREVVQSICSLLDELAPASRFRPHARYITSVPDRPGHDRRYAIDAAKIEMELGWQPRESFETGLRRTVEWYLTHRNWVEGVLSGSYMEWMALNYERRAEVVAR